MKGPYKTVDALLSEPLSPLGVVPRPGDEIGGRGLSLPYFLEFFVHLPVRFYRNIQTDEGNEQADESEDSSYYVFHNNCHYIIGLRC